MFVGLWRSAGAARLPQKPPGCPPVRILLRPPACMAHGLPVTTYNSDACSITATAFLRAAVNGGDNGPPLGLCSAAPASCGVCLAPPLPPHPNLPPSRRCKQRGEELISTAHTSGNCWCSPSVSLLLRPPADGCNHERVPVSLYQVHRKQLSFQATPSSLSWSLRSRSTLLGAEATSKIAKHRVRLRNSLRVGPAREGPECRVLADCHSESNLPGLALFSSVALWRSAFILTGTGLAASSSRVHKISGNSKNL